MNQQTLQVTIKFKTEHSPGNEAHLKQILQNYFRGKGIILDDNLEIEV